MLEKQFMEAVEEGNKWKAAIICLIVGSVVCVPIGLVAAYGGYQWGFKWEFAISMVLGIGWWVWKDDGNWLVFVFMVTVVLGGYLLGAWVGG
jgi:hypothetical protein